MTIECACVICHGPIRRTKQPVTAVVCNDDGGQCRARLRDLLRLRVQGLAHKYTGMRALHAYRRELLAVEARLAVVLTQGGWMEVG